MNNFRSPVYEICKVCKKFGVINMITDIVLGKHPVPSKRKYSELICGKGWKLGDKYWRAANTMNKKNDLLACTVNGARYMIWWQLSDSDTSMMKICECIAKILCHTSLLKVDDYRL